MFSRKVLFVFEDREEARKKEAEIVTVDFVARKDTYNMLPGGIAPADQIGEKNHMYGKIAPNAKPVKAEHRDGRSLCATSIEALGELIGIARQNVRKLLYSGKRGRRGWLVTACVD